MSIMELNEIMDYSENRFDGCQLAEVTESIEFETTDYNYDMPLGLLDDNNVEYIDDGKLLGETTYTLNGNEYSTDEHGRIINCESTPTLSPETSRDIGAQINAGGDDRQVGDQGGHIVGRDLGGDPGLGNMSAMDSRINQSDYKRMENDIKRSLNNGDVVVMSTELEYSDTSERPDRIISKVDLNGLETIYTFDNNIDGSLFEKIQETCNKSDIEVVKDTITSTDGKISSIKEEFDSEGNSIKTTVNITYQGEEGRNYRRQVVISNNVGE